MLSNNDSEPVFHTQHNKTHALNLLHGHVSQYLRQRGAKAFAKAGWNVVGQVGSHLVMTKPGQRANLSVPQHRELSVGLLRKLIGLAGLTVKEFLDLL